MKPEETKVNIRLGAFVLTGLVLFIVSIFYIGSESNIFARTFTIHALFKNVEGLNSGNNVWLSGVKIGTVKDVRIIDEGRVMVTLSLKDRQNQFIKADATASVGSDGLVGNKIVVIRPGTASATIQHNDTIASVSPADTQELINIAKDVGESTRSLTDDLQAIAQKVNEGQGIVGELLNNGDLATEIRNAVSGFQATSQQTAVASTQLTRLLRDMRSGDGLVSALVTDSTYVESFEAALNNVKEVSRNASQVSHDLEQMIQKMNNNQNALGVVLTDTAFARNLRTTMMNARQASAKLEENMEALQHNFLLRGYFRKKERLEEEN